MLRDIDHFYLNLEEPTKSCLLALRENILTIDYNVSSVWKYRTPFFCYQQKIFCYFWVDKKTKEPYIGIVEGNKIEHPLLEQGNRLRVKILRINPNEDLPIDTIHLILNQALDLYRDGIIKLKKSILTLLNKLAVPINRDLRYATIGKRQLAISRDETGSRLYM